MLILNVYFLLEFYKVSYQNQIIRFEERMEHKREDILDWVC